MSAILVGFQQYEAERLSLVRYQLMVAGQQSAQMAPLSSLALGSMQDAVESMLSLVVEHEHVVISNRNDFLQLFDAVAATVAGDPPISGYRPGAAAMNLARVNFKHHGNQAEASTIARHLGNSTDLVATLTDRVFGVRLDSISLLLFIRDDETRQHLEDAQTNLNAGKLEDAMTELKLAFDRLIHDYEQLASPICIELTAEVLVGIERNVVLEQRFQKVQERGLACVPLLRHKQKNWKKLCWVLSC